MIPFAYEPLTAADRALLAQWGLTETDPKARDIVRVGRVQRHLRDDLDIVEMEHVDGKYGPMTHQLIEFARVLDADGTLPLDEDTSRLQEAFHRSHSNFPSASPRRQWIALSRIFQGVGDASDLRDVPRMFVLLNDSQQLRLTEAGERRLKRLEERRPAY
jgi:hypothetical protein